MAISSAMRAALRALSYPEPDIRRTYRLERRVKTLTGRVGHPSEECRKINSAVCDDGQLIPVRIYFPPNQAEALVHSGPVLLFFHGGGWVMGSVESYDTVCSRLAGLTGLIVVSAEYRLAPEFPYPAAVNDCFRVFQALSCERLLAGIRAQDIVLIGDSAGGNLAAAVSLMARDQLELLPAGQILIYPALWNDYGPDSPYPSVKENGTDYLLTARRMCEFIEMYQGGPEAPVPEEPYFAPLKAGDLSHQPPTLIITAQYCPLRDEGEDYGEKLEKAGCPVRVCRIPDALHNFFVLPERFPAVRQTNEEICRFLSERFPQWEKPQPSEPVPEKSKRTLPKKLRSRRQPTSASRMIGKSVSQKSIDTPDSERS